MKNIYTITFLALSLTTALAMESNEGDGQSMEYQLSNHPEMSDDRVLEIAKDSLKKGRASREKLFGKNLSHLDLNLSHQKISFLPPGIENLFYESSIPIQVLELQDNYLKYLPDWLSELSGLKLIDLSNNPLDPSSVLAYLKKAPINIRVFLSKDLYQEIMGIEDLQNLHIPYKVLRQNGDEIMLQRVLSRKYL